MHKVPRFSSIAKSNAPELLEHIKDMFGTDSRCGS